MGLISVWGSPGGGKTTIALELAKSITKETGKNCILLYCDDLASPMSFLFSELEKKMGSVGRIIATAGFDQIELKRTMVTHSKNNRLAFLGYKNEESKLSYPAISEGQVIDLFVNLSQIAPYVVVDCKSDFSTDLVTQYALREGKCLVVGGSDLKSLSFFNATTHLMHNYYGFQDKQIKVANNPWDFETWQLIADKYIGVEYYFPYCHDIQTAYLEESSIEMLAESKDNRDFLTNMKALTYELIEIEEPIERRSRGKSDAKPGREKRERREKSKKRSRNKDDVGLEGVE